MIDMYTVYVVVICCIMLYPSLILLSSLFANLWCSLPIDVTCFSPGGSCEASPGLIALLRDQESTLAVPASNCAAVISWDNKTCGKQPWDEKPCPNMSQKSWKSWKFDKLSAESWVLLWKTETSIKLMNFDSQLCAAKLGIYNHPKME